MFYDYTVHITEKRNDGLIYSCYYKTFYSLKKAVKETKNALDKITAEPTGVYIYKCIIGGFSVPERVFAWGDIYYNAADEYLN